MQKIIGEGANLVISCKPCFQRFSRSQLHDAHILKREQHLHRPVLPCCSNPHKCDEKVCIASCPLQARTARCTLPR